MILWTRILYRARILTDHWIQRNAFTLGLFVGGGLTLLLFFVH